jgi:hypothetical protein
MEYNNLIEDEKQARNERIWKRVAFAAIFAGLIYIWYNWKRETK